MENNSLQHYGVLGMKWGRRKAAGSSSTSSNKKARSEPHDDYKKAHSSKNVKTMSDKELRDRINRLQMEKQYKQLSAKEKSAGAKIVGEILGNAGKQVATKYTAKALGSLADMGLNKMASKNSAVKSAFEALNVIDGDD